MQSSYDYLSKVDAVPTLFLLLSTEESELVIFLERASSTWKCFAYAYVLVKYKNKTSSLINWIGALEIDQWHELFYFMFSFLCFRDKPVYTR